MNIWDEKFYGGEEHLLEKFRIPHENFDDFIRLLKDNKAQKVLDLGCGTGRHTIALAKEGFEVYGIDISRNALKVCRERLKEENLEADLQFADIYKPLPYEDDFFDGMISASTLHHAIIKDIKGLIKELARVLQPSAVMMIDVPTSIDDFHPDSRQAIEPGTFVRTKSAEKGIPHHVFKDKKELKDFFGNFEVIKIALKKVNIPQSHPHFVMFGRMKK